ncbi:MAG: bifunctional precorrin-2 dehydrogenase/sirohydrochlorin ferrochelatase [Phycisphaerae bacterium]|nr:bifunctional precorrin-2 dehydrogenase/sirohydrochlorin ferrochelatase [Phycisphaerae bacterium]
MAKYPIFLEMAERRVVVVGGGAVAVRKAETLLDVGARLVVIADHINQTLTTMCIGTNAELIKVKYSKEYLTGATLVIAATNNYAINAQIYKDCQELEILCNVVDEPQLCDFFVPALVKRGDLQIAVGTDGSCPAYSGHLREKIERMFTAQHGLFLAELEKQRKKIIELIENPPLRKTILGTLVDDISFKLFEEQGTDRWQIFAQDTINSALSKGT